MLRLPTSLLSTAVPRMSETRLWVEEGDPMTPILSAWSNEFLIESCGNFLSPHVSVLSPCFGRNVAPTSWVLEGPVSWVVAFLIPATDVACCLTVLSARHHEQGSIV